MSEPEKDPTMFVGNEQSNWGAQGNFYGTVNIGVPPKESVENVFTPSEKRVWMVPYTRNRFFTGRENVLEELHERLKQGQAQAVSQPQAMSGLGGIGKTHIVVEYAHRYQQEYRYIFWALAYTREYLVSGYVTIAQQLKLAEQDEQDQTVIVHAVKKWLQEEQGWLLILDSADELKIVHDFLPPTYCGHILLTTRAQATGRLAERLEIETFMQEEGALFLLHRAGLLTQKVALNQVREEDKERAMELSEELGGLPLALDQAGAYIEETRCSLTAYLKFYRTRSGKLLQMRGNSAADYPNSVGTTWSLSFQKVEERNLAAAEMLRLCAFLAPDAIPEGILTRGAQHLGPVLSEMVEEDLFWFSEAMRVVGAYSLMRRDPQEQTISMHRLVQTVLREGMEVEVQKEWKQRAVLAVNTTFPEVKVEQWAVCERYIAHALVCEGWIQQEQILIEGAAEMLMKAGGYLKERAQYLESEVLLKHALSVNEGRCKPGDPAIATSLDNLACLYWSQGKYKATEPLFLKTLNIRRQKLGEEHPDTIETCQNLASLYLTQGKYKESESYFEQVIALNRKIHGKEHPESLICIGNLAELYRRLGKYPKAEVLLKDVFCSQEKQENAEKKGPDLAHVFHKQGLLSFDQGCYENARRLFKRALEIYENGVGKEHLQTAQMYHCLAEVSRVLDEKKEAEELFQRALTLLEKRVGSDHPAIASVRNGFGLLRIKEGKYSEAELLLLRALEIREQKLEAWHPDRGLSLNNLALLYSEQGRYEKAESLYKRAIAIWEKSLGEGHVWTQQGWHNYRVLLSTIGRQEDVEELKREPEVGARSLSMAMVLNNQATLYYEQEKYEEAEPLLHQVLEIRMQELGPKHPDTAVSMGNLAGLYQSLGKYHEAEQLFQKTLETQEQRLGPEHPDTATTLFWLAVVAQQQQRYAEALGCYERAWGIYKRVLGVNHPTTSRLLEYYAGVLRALGREEEAAALEAEGD